MDLGWRGGIGLHLRLGCVLLWYQAVSQHGEQEEDIVYLKIEMSERTETSAGSSSGTHLSFESLLRISYPTSFVVPTNTQNLRV